MISTMRPIPATQTMVNSGNYKSYSNDDDSITATTVTSKNR